MDKNDALRIVIFEYLLPMQRNNRVKIIRTSFDKEDVTKDWTFEQHSAGIFEQIHRLSERLLYSQWFPTSYFFPICMDHENIQVNDRRNVCALVDSSGPFVWDVLCSRRADPIGGFRVFEPGIGMSSGRFFVG